MRIKSMTASFGRLDRARLDLRPGLNLLEGPNESGKSTWCAFLRAMLYGVPTRERDRQGYLAEKNRYQPWSGAPMEGEMTLTWQGKDIIIRRGPKGTTPFGAFSAVCAHTGEPVPGLTAVNCGEELLGVSREVFERSAFVGQGGAAIGADAELERRIAALVSSGEEDVAYSEVAGRLKEWQRRRKFNRSGLIPKLEEELSAVSAALVRQEEAKGRAEEARRAVDTLNARQKEFSAALAAHRRTENRARRERYQAAQAALQEARREYEALRAAAERTPDSAALRAAQGDLAYYHTLEANRRLAEGRLAPARARAQELEARVGEDIFCAMSPEQAWQQASRDRDRAAAKGPGSAALSTLLVLLTGAVLVGLPLLMGAGPRWWTYGAAGAATVLALALNITAALRAKAWRAGTVEILSRYDAQYPDDILDRANAYREKQVDAQEARRVLESIQAAIEQMAGQKETVFSGLLELVRRFEPAVTDLFGVSAALSRGLSVREKLSAAQARLEGASTLAESLPKPEEREDGGEELPLPLDGVSPQELSERLSAVEGELGRVRNDLALATGELGALGEDGLTLAARKEEIEEELERRRGEYDALTLALETLDAANTEMRSRFSPALNASAGEVLAALTGGRYHRVGINRQFEAQAQAEGETLPRSTLSLSQGTAEQVYLAVRLAVCDLALPGDDPAPIVLDDALDAFDDTRMALALDYLLRLGERRQVLLFTCHGREGRYLAGRGEEDRMLSLPR